MRLLVDHGTHANLGDLAMIEAVVARLGLLLPGAGLHVVDRSALPSNLWGRDGVRRQPPYRVAVPGAQLASRLPWAWRHAGVWSRFVHRVAIGRVRQSGRAGRMRLVNAGDGAGPLTLADYCRPFDGLHVAGGGNLTDAFPDELFQRSCLMAAFADQGKPVVLTGQQIGPFRGPRPAAALAAVLDRTVFVGVRDPVDSLSFCRAALATPRHALMGDDALGGPGGAEAIDQSLLARLGIPRGPFLVANLRVGPYTDGGRRHVEAVAALLDEISRAAFLPVVFVPTALGASDSDIETGRAVAQATRIAAVTVLEPPGLTPAVVRAVIGAAHGAVAMSHHVCTFALAQGVPAVCLFDGPYYGQKARALAAFWQDDRFALPLAALDPAGAASLVVAVFRDADLRWRLAERGRDAVHQWEDVFDREVRRAFGSGRPLPVPGSA